MGGGLFRCLPEHTRSLTSLPVYSQIPEAHTSLHYVSNDKKVKIVLCSARETLMCQWYTKRQHILEKEGAFSKPRNSCVSILLAFLATRHLSQIKCQECLRAANASPLEAHLCVHVPSGGNSVSHSSASPAAGTAALSKWTQSSVCTRHFPTERPARHSWL